MTISINEIKTGMGLVINDEVWLVTEVNHVKPGKGAAFVRVRLKNLRTDLVLERTFRTAEKLEEAYLEEKKMTYQYNAGEMYHFMDAETYEERPVSRTLLGDMVKFLQDSMEVVAVIFKDKIVKVIPPNFITTRIVETEPGIRGDSSRAGNKPAKIDTGANVQVPLFINVGDWVKIDTRDGQGQYVERVNR